jgi:hypothetical protein
LTTLAATTRPNALCASRVRELAGAEPKAVSSDVDVSPGPRRGSGRMIAVATLRVLWDGRQDAPGIASVALPWKCPRAATSVRWSRGRSTRGADTNCGRR